MITAEGAGDDSQTDSLRPQRAEVGSLKPLQEDQIATYSATCLNTVKNVDNSAKKFVTVSGCAFDPTEHRVIIENVCRHNQYRAISFMLILCNDLYFKQN